MNDLTVHDGGWGIVIRGKNNFLLAYTNRYGVMVYQIPQPDKYVAPVSIHVPFAHESIAREHLLEAYGL